MTLGPLRFINASGGAGDWVYPGPTIDLQSPAAAQAVNGVSYLIYAEALDRSQWEIATGVYTASSGTFARTTIVANSLGTTAKITFGNPPEVSVYEIISIPTPVSASPITASLGADVAIPDTVYTDGPSIAQGSAGTWFVSGTVTVIDTGAARNFNCKLWDGSTVIDSATVSTAGAGFSDTVTLSGFIVSPAGNLRISAQHGSSSANCKFQFNQSGNSKDCTITAFRIA